MKKKLLSLAMLTIAFGTVSAQQSKDRIIKIIEEQNKKQIEVYNKIYGNAPESLKKSGLIDFDKIAIAGDDFIFFNRLTDYRGNVGSNIEVLQTEGVGGFTLKGDNLELTIFDGGRINGSHQEFINSSNAPVRIFDLENGAQNLNSHATSVAGFIGANGNYNLQSTNSEGVVTGAYPNAARGVLPNATINGAGFSTVNNLNVYQKIIYFDKHLTNHSYGVNYGWQLIDDETHVLGEGLRYNTSTESFTNSSQTMYGAYTSSDYLLDMIVNDNPKYTIVKAAGNEYGAGPASLADYNLKKYKSNGQLFSDTEIIPQDNCQFGAYCISTGSLAKNILVVGSVNVSTAFNLKFSTPSSIRHSNYSSAGPRKDGAIKPDLVAVGTAVISPVYSRTDLTGAYSIGSGTSYASPVVTGAVGAITQLKRLLTGDTNFYFFSDEVKAFLLHTTQEAGEFEGPDNKFGWGLLDAKKAAETVLGVHNNEIIFDRTNKVSRVNNEKLVKATGDQPLKVTLTWIDPEANNYVTTVPEGINDTSSKLVNDLDVRIIDTETNEVYFPWKLDLANVTGAAIKGDNTVDNIEQILINEPVANRIYKIVVSNKGLLTINEGSTGQLYTLLATGATPANLATTDVVNSKSEVSVYPTIAKDVVNIKSDSKIQKVDVIDVTGKLVSTTKADKVDVSSLPIGVYIVNITTEEGVTTKKIVKQ